MDLKNSCKMDKIDQIDIKKRSIVKRVKLLCDVLEIDHLGLVSDGVRRLQDEYNKYVVWKLKEKPSKFFFKDPCHPCVQDVGCDECSHLHPELATFSGEPTEDELLKDQENHEIMEAEIEAERKREGG